MFRRKKNIMACSDMEKRQLKGDIRLGHQQPALVPV